MADKFVLARGDKLTTSPQGLKNSSHSVFKGRLDKTRVDKRTWNGGNSNPLPSAGAPAKSRCTYCRKTGHQTDLCWQRVNDMPKPVLTASKNAAANNELPMTDNKTVTCISQPGVQDNLPQEGHSNVVSAKDPNGGTFGAFMSKGTVSVNGDTTPITILKDSESLQTLIRAGIAAGEETGKLVVLGCLWDSGSAPLVRLHLDT